MIQKDLQGNLWELKVKEALKDIPTIKSDLSISAYGSIDLDELNKTVERLNKIPNYDDLMKENNKLQSNWNSLRELIKWKPIEEYDENKYDWVLVKYYDGDYECVPTVAERRKGTNKWYDTNNNEIIFEVKYFFDMQLLDKMKELEGNTYEEN